MIEVASPPVSRFLQGGPRADRYKLIDMGAENYMGNWGYEPTYRS